VVTYRYPCLDLTACVAYETDRRCAGRVAVGKQADEDLTRDDAPTFIRGGG